MALIHCPECAREISDRSVSCIHCGFPLQQYFNENKEDDESLIEERKESCPYCGFMNDIGEDYCLSCEMRLTSYDSINKNLKIGEDKKNHDKEPKTPFWKKTWFMVLICIFSPILGIVLIWLNKKPTQIKYRILLSVILFLYTMSLLASNDEESKYSDSTTESSVESTIDDSKEEEKVNKKDFKSELEAVTNKAVAEKVYKILTEDIGFSELEYMEQLGETTNWKIKADTYEIVVTASDDVYRIFIPNSTAVFYEDDKVVMTKKELKEKSIGQTERNAYYQMAQEIIRGCLKNPNSADFPSIVTRPEEIAMQKNGDIIAVQSYVDAKNSFGAEVRSKWTVQYKVVDLKNYMYEVIFINLDGESSGEFIDMD